MPYKNPDDRNYKHEYALQKKRGDIKGKLERQEARRKLDKLGIEHEGKAVDHIKPLSKGGTNARSNLRVVPIEDNASFSRNSDHSVKVNKPKKHGNRK